MKDNFVQAIRTGDQTRLNHLLSADPTLAQARVDGQRTPLHCAASSNDVEALDTLLDHGADIEATGAVIAGGTPLADAVAFATWNACHGGQLPAAHSLLVQGADPRWIGHDHLTPLAAAKRNGNPDLLNWLQSQTAATAASQP